MISFTFLRRDVFYIVSDSNNSLQRDYNLVQKLIIIRFDFDGLRFDFYPKFKPIEISTDLYFKRLGSSIVYVLV